MAYNMSLISLSRISLFSGGRNKIFLKRFAILFSARAPRSAWKRTNIGSGMRNHGGDGMLVRARRFGRRGNGAASPFMLRIGGCVAANLIIFAGRGRSGGMVAKNATRRWRARTNHRIAKRQRQTVLTGPRRSAHRHRARRFVLILIWINILRLYRADDGRHLWRGRRHRKRNGMKMT